MRLEQFLRRVRAANLTVNLSKSKFLCETVQYLGYEIGGGRIKPVASKVKAILDFPRPLNKPDLMRFLGMINFYRKFCNNIATVAAPLTELLRKRQKFRWEAAQQQSFDSLKRLLVSAPVLQAPKFGARSELYVDASSTGVGAALHQFDEEGNSRPVGYFSKKLNRYQLNYSTVEKEALALVLALDHSMNILSPSECLQVHTDHNPLVFLDKMKNKNQKLMRWSLMLQSYRLKIDHINGAKNKVADALSRAPV